MSILELLVVLLLLSFFMSSAVSNLSRLKNPLEDASSGALGFTKEVRARAAATTSAYVLYPASANELRAKYANNCSATSFTVDPALRFELPEHSVLTDTTWSICFNSRGLAETNESFIIQNLEGESRTLEVFLGGAVRIQP